MLGLEAPLYLLGDGCRQPQLLDRLFHGLQGPLGPRLLLLQPRTRLLEATPLGLWLSLLPGALDALVVGSGLGHGMLLPVVASPRFSRGGDHDPFFIWAQVLSWPSGSSPATMAT